MEADICTDIIDVDICTDIIDYTDICIDNIGTLWVDTLCIDSVSCLAAELFSSLDHALALATSTRRLASLRTYKRIDIC